MFLIVCVVATQFLRYLYFYVGMSTSLQASGLIFIFIADANPVQSVDSSSLSLVLQSEQQTRHAAGTGVSWKRRRCNSAQVTVRLKQPSVCLCLCLCSGYGQTGPQSQSPGYDSIASAVSGMMHITGPEVRDFSFLIQSPDPVSALQRKLHPPGLALCTCCCVALRPSDFLLM